MGSFPKTYNDPKSAISGGGGGGGGGEETAVISD